MEQIQAGQGLGGLDVLQEQAVDLSLGGAALEEGLGEHPVPLQGGRGGGKGPAGLVQGLAHAVQIAVRLPLGPVLHPQAEDLQQQGGAQQQGDQGGGQQGGEQPVAEGGGQQSSHGSSSPPW